jgi:hypothetical protein
VIAKSDSAWGGKAKNTWLFMLLLSCRSLQRPGIYCQFLVKVHVVDMLIGNWVSYLSNSLK